jgi:pimeloyl-ACP methyl ester carboxylesterase
MATNDLVPFRIDIAQEDLDDLNHRLDRTRWAGDSPTPGWSQGVPEDYLRELVRYWRQDYDWRAAEAALNAHDQFLTTIDGARIHVIHVRAARSDAPVVLLTHGWPGSTVEFQQLIGPLTDPAAHGGDPGDAMHVVVPSLPGYGFSGPTTDAGWDVARIARAWAELMGRLGYSKYVAHGGDWGASVSRELGVQDREHVTGVHLTMLSSAVAQPGREAELPDELSDAEQAQVTRSRERFERFQQDELGYGWLQSTRPQTLGYALADSPVGQLAWIVEKFRQWSDCVERPDEVIDRDLMITDVMLYWLTNTAASSARLYWETAHAGTGWGAAPETSTVPTALAIFPKDTSQPVRRLAETHNHIVRWTEFDRGGHFAGLEEPGHLVDDLRAFTRQLAAH